MKRLIITLGLCLSVFNMMAQRMNVELLYDKTAVSPAVVAKAEGNLRALTSEINSACQGGRPIDLSGVSMSDFARKAINMLWKNVHFETRTTNLKDKLWVFKRSRIMQVMHIPFVLRDDSPVDGDNQDAVVEFDLTGKITDFRFALDPAVEESMEKYNEIADDEIQAIIQKYVQHFYTYYKQKDIDNLNKIFSDDAIIITGNVIKVKTPEAGIVEKVNFKKQTKTQYLRNLQRCFARNKWIRVDFQILDNPDGGRGKFITHRRGKNGRDFYGVRLRQEWKSANGYHDEGYVFLLWEFPEGGDPIIHVRTWQPEMLNGKKIDYNEIISDTDFIF